MVNSFRQRLVFGQGRVGKVLRYTTQISIFSELEAALVILVYPCIVFVSPREANVCRWSLLGLWRRLSH